MTCNNIVENYILVGLQIDVAQWLENACISATWAEWWVAKGMDVPMVVSDAGCFLATVRHHKRQRQWRTSDK